MTVVNWFLMSSYTDCLTRVLHCTVLMLTHCVCILIAWCARHDIKSFSSSLPMAWLHVSARLAYKLTPTLLVSNFGKKFLDCTWACTLYSSYILYDRIINIRNNTLRLLLENQHAKFVVFWACNGCNGWCHLDYST